MQESKVQGHVVGQQHAASLTAPMPKLFEVTKVARLAAEKSLIQRFAHRELLEVVLHSRRDEVRNQHLPLLQARSLSATPGPKRQLGPELQPQQRVREHVVELTLLSEVRRQGSRHLPPVRRSPFGAVLKHRR